MKAKEYYAKYKERVASLDYNESIQASIQAVAALIENKALLKPGEQYYSIHVIDNISMSDCNLYSTGDLSRAGLVNALKEIFKEVENQQK